MGSVKCCRSINELSKFKAKHNNNSANIKREEAVKMKKAKTVTSSESSRKMRPALSRIIKGWKV